MLCVCLCLFEFVCGKVWTHHSISRSLNHSITQSINFAFSFDLAIIPLQFPGVKLLLGHILLKVSGFPSMFDNQSLRQPLQKECEQSSKVRNLSEFRCSLHKRQKRT
jgi:hypothetical protein